MTSDAERELLELWPTYLGRPQLQSMLSGFVSELVVLVTVDGPKGPRPLVAKLSRDTDRFAAASEARLMRAWANKGLAPTVVASNGRLTVTEWVPGRPLEVQDLPRAAELLWNCHQTRSAGLPALSDLLTNRFGKLAVPGAENTPDAVVMAAAEQLLSRIDSDCCAALHADCHPRNLIVNDERIVVIDPLGADGDGAFDLAMLAATCDQDPYQSLAALRGSYPGDTETLAGWFAWCLAFRWRVEVNHRPKIAQRLWAMLSRLAEDRRWWRVEFH